VGVDISPEVISMAKERAEHSAQAENVDFRVASSDRLDFLEDQSLDKVLVVLALENIEDVRATFSQCHRVLRRYGTLHLVLTHPAFRIPGRSSWGWDGESRVLYRRIDGYLSESRTKIKVHPGSNPREEVISFHRPLQWYFKHLGKSGFCVTRLEEWISNKTSEPGPRAEAENKARKEIPLFLYLEARPQ